MNPPQPASGLYACRGCFSDFYCEGIYNVSTARAQAADQHFKEQFRLEEEAKRREQVRAELRAVRQWEQEEKARQKMATEANARYEAEMRTQARRDRTAVTQQPPLARRDAQRKRPGPTFVVSGPRDRSCGTARQQPQRQPESSANNVVQNRYANPVAQQWYVVCGYEFHAFD